ncbi:alpha/beta hydrolase [Pelagerythrobacter aerophilus]|uniref:Alpha/beta hydrolase n=2 Tax=Pelagerythrobacter aerophilus TaxID=2306995 RepID=A0A418NKA5_9SPHN|nr:alpha/beta hydrolase [Pelagerythrobacter aerophilus]
MLAAAPLEAQPVPQLAAATPIVVGQSQAMEYRPGDVRQVNVYLPDGYADSGKAYPVLYLIDGGLSQDFLHIAGASQLGSMWGRSQPAIVVGIETKDRRAELIGSRGNTEQRKAYPTAGNSAAFRTFIRDRVKPFVASHYRTSGADAVIGESLAGLFIVETWLREPSLFGSYAAVSPSIWWDDGALAKQAPKLIGPRQVGHRLYVATEDEGADYQANFERLTAALSGHMGWCYALRPDVTHATIYHAVSPEALQFLFPPSEAPDPQFGFEVQCSRKS